MKKHIYKLTVGLLIGMMIFGITGCSSNMQNKKSSVDREILKGRYLEENIEMPNGIKGLIDYNVKNDGTIEIYAYNHEDKLITYTSEDGQSWESKDATWLNELLSEGNRVGQIDNNEKGEYYVLYYDKNFKTRIGKVGEDNKIQLIPYELEEESPTTCIKTSENGEIFIGTYSGVTRINEADGRVIAEYTVTETDGECIVVDDKLMIIDTQRGGIVVFNLASGKEEKFIRYKGTLWGSKLLTNDEGNVYIANEEGVSRVIENGDSWEKIIESSMSSFGTPSLYMRKVMMKGNNEFIVEFGNSEDNSILVRYYFDPNVPSKPETEVNLYMLEDNKTIRQAVAEYHRQNQEVVINMQVGVSEGNAVTKSDAIRTLNTQLLSGRGPDILVLDGLPIQSYMDKGVLLNMSDWVDSMKDSSQWLKNITEAYRQQDGTIYALPTRFKIPTLWGEAKLVNDVGTLEELASWAQNNPGKKVLGSISPEEIIRQFYGMTAHQWINENGQIKEEAFVDFLEALKVLTEQGSVGTEQVPTESSPNSPARCMAEKEVELYIAELTGFKDIPYLNSAIIQRGNGDFGLALDKDGGIYSPVGIIGINSNSENQEIAKEIIKIAMSKEVQMVDLYDGFPINRKALEEQVKINKDAIMTSQVQRQPETQMAYIKLKEEVDKLIIPAVTDEVLMNLIIEETKGYFDGEKTAKEAAAAVATRTRAYLAE